MIVRYVSLTDVGRHRDHNEDAIREPTMFAPRIAGRGWRFAVADGMGGHAYGELARLIAVRALSESYSASEAKMSEALITALTANSAVHDAGTAALQRAGQAADDAQRMGTTLVACVIADGHLLGVSIGDKSGVPVSGRCPHAPHALVETANENGGPDNVSVILVKCTE